MEASATDTPKDKDFGGSPSSGELPSDPPVAAFAVGDRGWCPSHHCRDGHHSINDNRGDFMTSTP
jgi:hypothetical protein